LLFVAVHGASWRRTISGQHTRDRNTRHAHSHGTYILERYASLLACSRISYPSPEVTLPSISKLQHSPLVSTFLSYFRGRFILGQQEQLHTFSTSPTNPSPRRSSAEPGGLDETVFRISVFTRGEKLYSLGSVSKLLMLMLDIQSRGNISATLKVTGLVKISVMGRSIRLRLNLDAEMSWVRRTRGYISR
jgi:hypothetical protein